MSYQAYQTLRDWRICNLVCATQKWCYANSKHEGARERDQIYRPYIQIRQREVIWLTEYGAASGIIGAMLLGGQC